MVKMTIAAMGVGVNPQNTTPKHMSVRGYRTGVYARAFDRKVEKLYSDLSKAASLNET